MKKVAICLATCNRNEMLSRCLSSVVSSAKSELAYEHFLVVVDNNCQPVSEEMVRELSSEMEVIFDWEPTPGIPFARNLCLKNALANGADFIAFIDDDEYVDKDWLGIMLEEVDKEGVDVVSGKVNQENNGSLYSKRKFENGSLRDRAETDNVIMKAWIAKKISFDEDFAQTGGSDALFFRQAFARGATIKVCNSAVVTEELPVVRLGLRWRLQRHYRYGLTHCLIERKLHRGVNPIILLVRGGLLVPLGLVEFLIKVPLRGIEEAKVGLDRCMRGVGSLAYFLGLKYNEYKR